MRGHNDNALGCLSLCFGVMLAIGVPGLLLGLNLSLDSQWLWLAPGWRIFNPGRDDGPQLCGATLLNVLLYAAICYGLGRILRRKFEDETNADALNHRGVADDREDGERRGAGR